MQEQEERQRELRAKLAQAKIQNVQGLGGPDAIFGPLDDYVEKRRPITRLFFSVYDNLGVLIAINFFTFVLTLPLLLVLFVINVAAGRHQQVGALLPLLLLGLCAPPAWAAASSFCAKITDDQMHPLSGYWSDYRRFAGKSIVLAVGQWLVAIVLLYATGWYLAQAGALKFIAVVSLYALLFWALGGLYLWPLMVRGYRWRAILRNAGVLVVAAPLRSFSVLLVLVILTGLLGITGIGLVALVFALWAMLPNQALVLTRERLERRTAGRTSNAAT